MYFGVDFYPEYWVFPYAGTAENPEAAWEQEAALMAKAGVNVVRVGEFSWGLCEPSEGKYDFLWLRRVMDIMEQHNIKVVLGTPTAAPPVWLAKKHPEILPLDEFGRTKHEGTRRAVCLSSDIYWDYSKRIVSAMAEALADHPQLIAWQIDNSMGGNDTEFSFNEAAREEWHFWLQAKYETIERLNEQLGLRFWGQTVTDWDQIPMPMYSPAPHNPALLLDWRRFCSDTMVQFVKMQADLLRQSCPSVPVTVTMRAFLRQFDHYDMAEVVDFVSIESNVVVKAKVAELACEVDLLRSLKKSGIKTPDGEPGFWAMEQKVGQANWQEVNSLVRPGVIRLFTHQLLSRGASGILFFRWRQTRIGGEKFYGGVLPHHLGGNNRVYQEISQLGEEVKLLGPALQGTRVLSQACILYTHDTDWALQLPNPPTKHFSLREHIQLFYNALHDRNIQTDFARPVDDLSPYKIVFAPSLHVLSPAEADRLKLYVQNGGTLVGTFNTALVNEHHIVPDSGFPGDLTDLFGLEVLEFDPIPPGDENHLTFKGAFPTSHLHPAKLWCDIIEPKGCQILAVYSKDFYAGKPAVTMNTFGLGKAIYIGTQSHQHFYHDLIGWLRQICSVHPLLKVPENVEVSMREKDGMRIFFLLNHQASPVRVSFYKPMHDFLTDTAITGNYDLPPHGVLVLDEHTETKTAAPAQTA
ncbi:MAG: beta-galactosidase [Verrucomicrobia bacterium]|nr:beta-galactosidase [Verrucomicrobiota bacterium]MDE3099584.1 beta-galactosidase [Verrucomicrobiota bacterium]